MDRAVEITPALVTGKLFTIRTGDRYVEPSAVVESNYPHYEWVCQGSEFVFGESLFARGKTRRPGTGGTDAQTYHLFRMTPEYVCIAPRGSTGVVDYAYSAWEISKRVMTWEPHGGNNQMFSLTRTGAGDNPMRIQSRHGGVALEQWYRSTGDDGWIVGENPATTPRQAFTLEVDGDLGLPAPRTGGNRVLQLGTDVVPRLRRFNEPLPVQVPDPPILIGEVYLPFFVVDDTPAMNRAEQARRSPYYLLRREQTWVHAIDRRIGPGQALEESLDIGITRETETTLERSVNLTLTPTVGATYKGVTASMGGTLTADLQLTERSKEVYVENRKSTFSIAASPRTVRAVWWNLVDRYTLVRTDGSVARTWEIRVPGLEVKDSYVGD